MNMVHKQESKQVTFAIGGTLKKKIIIIILILIVLILAIILTECGKSNEESKFEEEKTEIKQEVA